MHGIIEHPVTVAADIVSNNDTGTVLRQIFLHMLSDCLRVLEEHRVIAMVFLIKCPGVRLCAAHTPWKVSRS